MIGYASRTGTKRNLAALRDAGWHLLVSATGCLRPEGFAYAIDNGSWTAYQKGEPPDGEKFRRALDKLGSECEWAVPLDIVAGGKQSLELSLEWLPRVLDSAPRALVAVQDGMEVNDLRGVVGDRVGIFVGGSDRWKEQTLGQWATFARAHGIWCHVARVNTARRIALCQAAGATSFDGTSASRYAKTLPLLDGARRQLAIMDATPPIARPLRAPKPPAPASELRQLALLGDDPT